MSHCGISRRRLIAGTAAAAALSQVSAESLSIASARREAVVYQTTSDFNLTHVVARGRVMMRDGEVVVKGTFEI